MAALQANLSNQFSTLPTSAGFCDSSTKQRPICLGEISHSTVSPMTPPLTPVRETGAIEKLLHSYGFIQCYEHDTRLFFHFSEYHDKITDLSVNDNVEFEISYDKRTGKPLAVNVCKIVNSQYEIVSDERMVGTVFQEAKQLRNKNMNNPSVTTDGLGQVTFERSGECFYLPYSTEDLDGVTDLHVGDVVSFYIATDKRYTKNGLMHARKIQLVKPPPPARYQGVVCSMRESFGFVERSDVVKEIFFHYTEFAGDINELNLGDDVEFDIEVKAGKEYAINVSKLMEGTVVFEDVNADLMRGRVQKTLKSGQNRKLSDPLSGKIVYETVDGARELPYGDKDQVGEYTLFEQDIVEFNIATDRRDGLQRATNIRLVNDTFLISGERRETGVLATLNKGYGFITCLDREARLFFHFSEVMDAAHQLEVDDELEFTVIKDPANPEKLLAIRIKVLPRGIATDAVVSDDKYVGVVEREPAAHKTPNKNKGEELGSIVYEIESSRRSILYQTVTSNGFLVPKCGDKVEFQVSQLVRNSRLSAVNIRILERNTLTKYKGFVAALKDTYGFIENEDHEKEVFFHFSAFENGQSASPLDIGDEVEYTITRKGTKYSAENITRLPKGTVSPEELHSASYEGRIVRPLRIVDPDQDEYFGIVQVGFSSNDNPETYPYGITGLADKRDFLQAGDAVRFQLATVVNSGKLLATNICGIRKYIRAKIDSIKGQYGFLDYEATPGRKLFFHMTEVHGMPILHPGDEIEFVVVQNQKTGRYSAVSLRKIDKEQRPDHLLPRRLKSVEDTAVRSRMTLVRQPFGPDGSRGFRSKHPMNEENK